MSIMQIIGKIRPTEVYNLAAQSHVQVSFDAPEFTADVDATGVLRVLEAVRQNGLIEVCKIYQASTSELYGKVEEVPQNENTPFHPYSPYAVAKLYGYWIVKEYREAYNMFCCSGILSTTRANAGARLSLPVKLRWLPHALRRASRTNFIWVTYPHCAIGVMPRTT